jgi:hypothetical protein
MRIKMNDYKNKSVCVYDNGLFVELAIKLSESFGKVYYYSPWESAFPKSNQTLIGFQIKEIIRVNNFWDIIDDIDLFCFPDVYSGSIQLHLESLNKRIWGSKKGEELELYRNESKQYMKSIDIPIGNYTVIKGTNDLKKYLKENENKYVKISVTRGDTETFFSENYNIIESKIDDLECKLGARKYITEFIVEDSIDNAVETGYDGYCIDGIFPKSGICGIEIKDKGYVGIFKNYEEIPQEIISFNEKISDTLKKYKYRNFISTEIRITQDKIPYIIDPCMRAGSPPSEIYINMYKNLADIIWNGSEGKCIEPVVENKYAIEVILSSKWADNNWQIIQFPAELRDNIKFRDLTFINNNYYVIPQQTGHSEIGALIVLGNSFDEVKEKIKEYSQMIKGYDLYVHTEIIDEGFEEIEKLKLWGINLL